MTRGEPHPDCSAGRTGARAFWIAAPRRGEIRDEVLRSRADDEVELETIYSGISRGTESIVFNGQVPPSERERMRAPFQEGTFPGPVKYGYASVARVADGPSSLAGRAAFVLYPHQTRYVVPTAAVHVIPDDVPPARAVLAANMETAINGVWDARVHVGDRVAVVGGGTVGCLAAWLLGRIPGCEVTLVDVNPSRQAIARAIGVAFAHPTSAPSAARDADVVVHASGRPEGLETAIALAGFESTIVELSWYGDMKVTLPLGAAFHARRLRLQSSQVGHVAPSQRARWDTGRRMALALSLLADPRLDALITGESRFDELPDVMARLAAGSPDTILHRIAY